MKDLVSTEGSCFAIAVFRSTAFVIKFQKADPTQVTYRLEIRIYKQLVIHIVLVHSSHKYFKTDPQLLLL